MKSTAARVLTQPIEVRSLLTVPANILVLIGANWANVHGNIGRRKLNAASHADWPPRRRAELGKIRDPGLVR